MSKLTLSVDADVVARAKRYAKKNGQSVSEIVETYLDLITEKPKSKRPGKSLTHPNQPLPPILSEILGSLKGADPEDYKRYLMAKFG